MVKSTTRSVRQIKTIINNIGRYIAGEIHDRYGIGRLFWSTIAAEFYTKIYESYRIRSEGGADELGNTWPKLSTSTIVQREIKKGNLRSLGLTRRQSGTAFNDRTRGLLSPREDAEWRKVYSKNLRKLLFIVDEKTAKAIAAAKAWKELKARGAKTRKEVTESSDHLIMRVTDTIFQSLKPASSGTRGYRARKNQLYERVGNVLKLGTTVAYAKFHNKSRPVIPENVTIWVEDIVSSAFSRVAVHVADNVI